MNSLYSNLRMAAMIALLSSFIVSCAATSGDNNQARVADKEKQKFSPLLETKEQEKAPANSARQNTSPSPANPDKALANKDKQSKSQKPLEKESQLASEIEAVEDKQNDDKIEKFSYPENALKSDSSNATALPKVVKPEPKPLTESDQYINTFPYKIIKSKATPKSLENKKPKQRQKQTVKTTKQKSTKSKLQIEPKPKQNLKPKPKPKPKLATKMRDKVKGAKEHPPANISSKDKKPKQKKSFFTHLEQLPIEVDEHWTLSRDVGEGCALHYRQFYMDDGQGQSRVNVSVFPSRVMFKTRSNIDLSYPNLGLQIDGNQVIPIEGLTNKTSIAFTHSYGELIKQMSNGKQLSLLLGFWPTWPITQAYPLEIQLGMFDEGYEALTTCIKLEQELG